MVNKLERTDSNLASNFNNKINGIADLNVSNKGNIENLTIQAAAHLSALNAQITTASAYLTGLQNLLATQANTLSQNQGTRNKLTTIENLIPQRLNQYPALSSAATALKIESDQYQIGVSVLAASPTLSELIAVGKQSGKVLAVNNSGAFNWIISPSGSDKMATACYQIQAATGSGGGSAAAGVWIERGLNTVVKSDPAIALSSGRLTLQPGSYVVWGYVAASECGRFKTQFKSVDLTFRGSNVASSVAGDEFNGFSYFEASFAIVSAATFWIEQIIESVNPTPLTTLGSPANVAGSPEVYGAVVVLKL